MLPKSLAHDQCACHVPSSRRRTSSKGLKPSDRDTEVVPLCVPRSLPSAVREPAACATMEVCSERAGGVTRRAALCEVAVREAWAMRPANMPDLRARCVCQLACLSEKAAVTRTGNMCCTQCTELIHENHGWESVTPAGD